MSGLPGTDERASRYERLRASMERAGYDALVVPGRTDSPGRLQYVTNVHQWAGRNYCVVFREADPVCVIDPVNVYGVESLAVAGWVPTGLMSANDARSLADVLEASGAATGIVGIVGRGDLLALRTMESLQGMLPAASFRDATADFDSVRKRKTPQEIAWLRESSKLADTALDAAIDQMRPGMRERDIAAEIQHQAFSLGALEGTVQVAHGSLHRLRPASDDVVMDGDVLVIEAEWAGPSGYWVEAMRTVSFGAPNPRQLAYYEMKAECLKAVVEALRPGVMSDRLLDVAGDVYRAHGYGDDGLLVYLAHGIGADVGESPFIPGEPSAIEAGEALTVHPQVTARSASDAAEVAAIGVADTVVVHTSGAEQLATVPHRWRQLDA